MDKDHSIQDHYTHGKLIDAIKDGLAKTGVALDQVTIDDLAPVDEFHIGGREATEEFLSQLNLTPDHHVLDIGSGIGGGARFAATRYGCRVSGIDLTEEFVETASALSDLVGLTDCVNFHQGSALETPFDDATFDAAFMLHVGMNIPDKGRLFAEAVRVIKPGGVIGIYDIMALTDEPLAFPVPWSSTPETSAVASPCPASALMGQIEGIA